jgi:Putative metallopeptidase
MRTITCRSLDVLATVVVVALASTCWTLVTARAEGAPGNIANYDGIFIDGYTFQVVLGRAKGDAADQIKTLGARELGPAAIVFRSGDKLYVVGVPLRLQAGAAAAGVDVYVTADDDPPGPIRIEYVPPKNPEHQKIYDMVKERRVLETVQKIFSPFRLPVDLIIKTVGCDGVSNAWYQREGKQPTVSVCYEYLQEIWKSMPTEMSEGGMTPPDAICGQLFFAIAHELGHAMFDIFDVPVFGRQEDAADQFATFIMLQFGGERARRLIKGAAYGYHEYIKNYKDNPKVTLPLAAFSSDHATPEERFYNLLCTAYGYDDKLFSPVVQEDHLPQSRAKKCKFEYDDLKFAFRQVFGPHLDYGMVRKVLATDWFTGPSQAAER